MKKLLTVLACVLLISAFSVLPVFAVGAEDWTAGNGFVSNGVADGSYPVTVTETDKGVQVTHGGYYQTGDNWGGAAYNKPLKLDGLKVVISMDKFPTADSNADCWFSVDFLTQPHLFYAGGDYAKNKGIANLIRYSRSYVQEYGPDGWASAGENTTNDVFALAQGQTLTVEVNKVGDAYQLTFNGVKANSLYSAAAFPNGEGYLVISGSIKELETKDTYSYTILSINDEPTITVEATEDAGTETADTTADAGIAFFMLIVASSAAIVLKKRR